MKKIYLLFYILIISSCSISNIKFEAIKPAEINIPTEIETVAIVNRSTPKKNNVAENILDGLLSGEAPGVDKFSSNDCINSLKLKMTNSPRFNLISTMGIEFKGTGTSEMPKPLKWKKIENNFKNYDIDALIVLESFDSSSKVLDLGIKDRKVKVDGKWKKVIEHVAGLDIEVQSGWRIYDLNNKKIIDEQKFFDRKLFENSDKTIVLAKKGLPKLGYAISQAAIFSGEQFYFRVSPHYITINREYYKNLKNIKGFKIKSDNSNNLFTEASNYASDNNWREAVKIWKQFTDYKNTSVASRAYFNLALASEANGKIDIAITWINKSLNLGNKKAKVYRSILEKRKLDLIKLDKQIVN